MKKLHESGDGVGKIAKQLGRSKDTVFRHVFAKNIKKAKKSKGRPRAYCMTPAGYVAMERVYQKLLRESKGRAGVTPQMVKDRMGLTCSTKSISRAFWSHGVYFRPQYKKPDLSVQDRRDRKAWGSANKHRSAAQWNKYVLAIIDNKAFQVYALASAASGRVVYSCIFEAHYDF